MLYRSCNICRALSIPFAYNCSNTLSCVAECRQSSLPRDRKSATCNLLIRAKPFGGQVFPLKMYQEASLLRDTLKAAASRGPHCTLLEIERDKVQGCCPGKNALLWQLTIVSVAGKLQVSHNKTRSPYPLQCNSSVTTQATL